MALPWSQLPIPTVCGEIHEDRSSSDAIAMFKRWIESCQQHHDVCEAIYRRAVPGRILDCTYSSVVKLCNFPDEPDPKYITLSYCWGGTAVFQLDHTTLSELSNGVPYESLPQLFQDTMLLARRLGIRYVWIDALCILQDSRSDKDREIAKMADTYGSAFFVLIAASARSPREGFLQLPSNLNAPLRRFGRLKHVWRDPKFRQNEDLGPDRVRFREKLHTTKYRADCCKHEVVGQRAWTYQERLLARRCLIFRESEVVFECRSACWCECSSGEGLGEVEFKSQLLSRPRDSGLTFARGLRDLSKTTVFFPTKSNAYRFWKNAVRAYSSRQMTNETDRLRAISAIAVLVQERTGDEYLAGVWKQDLLSQLMWFHFPSTPRLLKPYEMYIAPSWSWASVPVDPFYLRASPDYDESYRAQIDHAECTLAGPNPFGAVKDGYIVLVGVHCSAYALVSKRHSVGVPNIKLFFECGVVHEADSDHSGEFSFLEGLRVTSSLMETESRETENTLQRHNVFTDIEQEACSGRVRLLWLVSDVCLILAYSRRVPGAYERIGILGPSMAPPIPDENPSRIQLV